MEFKQWIMDKFMAWEKTQKRRQSYSAFARYLNIKQSTLSQWLNGNYTPTGENLIKVADKLGPEVYKVLGLPEPEIFNVPSPARDGYERASEKISSLGIPKDSPEAWTIFIQEMSKVGLTVIATTTPSSPAK